TYTSSLVVGGNDASNYDVSITNANLSIGRAALTLTASGGSKTYDGGTSSSGTVSVSGLQGSDTITGLSQVYANKNAGTGKTISVASGYTLSDGNSGSNYDVSTVDASNGVITPASLLITVNPASRAAGTANPVFTGTVTGFVGGETQATATSGQLVFQTSANVGSGVGAYTVLGTGLTALFDNYVFTQAPGNGEALTITAALPVVDTFLPKAAPVPNFPDNAVPTLGPTPQSLTGSNLNYVSLSSSRSAPDTSATTPEAQVQPTGDAAGSAGRPRTARLGVAATAVPSANGPLDVFVLDGGLNLGTQANTAP
uniref:MBG domain-containing protein n=1 Tax=Aquabacterium sp. TaxID=1872578 RepID=UPI0025C198A2